MRRKLHRTVAIWHLKNQPMRPVLLIPFFVGSVAGSILGLFLDFQIPLRSAWFRWLAGESVHYSSLLIAAIRFPLGYWLCQISRFGRRISAFLLCAQGALMSHAAAELLVQYGISGIVLAAQMLWVQILFLPFSFFAVFRCYAQRRPAQIDGAWIRGLVLLLLSCLCCTAVDYFITPVVLSVLVLVQ